ncbi:site-specific integrase [Mycobacterium intracellulare subsp. intracellulare]|uniref:tyrosine-type recombinase/integrase n=1 Tax=Mycobacterium intracellulare TaxID=1767 RepID=UPI00055E4284|nr:site-specific integrase [Mycobacterium intracellulare]UGU07560.1 site-specific integrase [Mycobacterium intracellulare subsp. intracellulare]BCO56456.1 putative prophage phiRv2 integrase [Mycobacterium intracellulare]BCO93597.1 putative prophage phiRv2 integrase [Mycobacterium intracellulare]
MARKRRGFGRIRRERSGRYSAAYIGPDAKLHHAPRTYAAESDAEGWLANERRKIDLGTWGAVERSDGITLRAYADKWIGQRQLRPRTRQHYESMLGRLILPDLGAAKIVTLTPAKVRVWHAELGAEHPTRNAHAYALLHAICATAVQDEVLDANPCRIRAAMQTTRKRDVDVLTPADVDRLAGKMPPRLRASVILAAWCGLRWGETSELRRKDVSGDCATLRVRRAVTYRKGEFIVGQPKTAAGVRDVAVPPHIRPIIKEHLKNHVNRDLESLLFPVDAEGSHMHGDNYRTHWEKARASIGKPNLRVHDLRHVGAVLAAQSGATTAELMHRLGHTTPQMALRYQHVAEGRDAEIAERLSKLAKGKSE